MSFSRVGPNQTIERGQIRVAKSCGRIHQGQDHELPLPRSGNRIALGATACCWGYGNPGLDFLAICASMKLNPAFVVTYTDFPVTY